MKQFTIKSSTTQKTGTVTAVSLPNEFQFQVNNSDRRPIVQDFVIVEHPTQKDIPIIAKIINISRFNPLLPEESTLELAQLNLNPEMSPLPVFGKMEMVAANCQVIGFQDEFGRLRSPGFPVSPGDSVYLPNEEFINSILSGKDTSDDLLLGNLRGRKEVQITMNGNEILNKHLAVLAMTGAGKTYAVSVVIEELMKKGYPLLIIDPHSDYSNISEKEDGKPFEYKTIGGKKGSYKLKKFSTGIDMQELSLDEFIDFVQSMCEEEVSAPQRQKYREAYHYMRKEKKGLSSLYEYITSAIDDKADQKKEVPTLYAVLRQLNTIRSVMKGAPTELEVEDIAKHLGVGKGVILDLNSLPYQLQRITVQIVLEKLFDRRKDFVISSNVKNKIPPTFIIVEEAHNYAPAQTEGEVYPSRMILRRVATEGRKFGFSLCVVTQRPSRIDSTVLSQCNSQIILRIVNPDDQQYIRKVVESLSYTDLLALSDLAQGEALLSGSMTPIPCAIQVRKRESKEGIPAVHRLSELDQYA